MANKKKAGNAVGRKKEAIRNVLIVDVETTGVDPEVNRIVELGFVWWDALHRSIVTCGSCVLDSDSNEAEEINRIPAALLREVDDSVYGGVLTAFDDASAAADIYMAHNAPFDSEFLYSEKMLASTESIPWVCTMSDFEWPVYSPSKSLMATAVAHGVGINAAHRALTDCLLIAYLLERVDDVNDRLEKALERAMTPKFVFEANVPFLKKDLAKDEEFRWNSERKAWLKTLTEDEARAIKKFPLIQREPVTARWLK